MRAGRCKWKTLYTVQCTVYTDIYNIYNVTNEKKKNYNEFEIERRARARWTESMVTAGKMTQLCLAPSVIAAYQCICVFVCNQ